ncbi:hypothetical protein O6H91_22G008300 [Diphasiastrum complanatum]|uniref:Uncharacterized protein n=2 Tax=Diphasiastrum complanatum TaxID=34168 RepID=A0ACC2ACS4_DIPCM|nr:hypothetical protein O6H91_22G008300 [Diphasiastrum complanatum]
MMVGIHGYLMNYAFLNAAAMDTSERPTAGAMFGAEKLSPLGVSGSGSKKINKISQKRSAVKLRKEKAMEKALSTSEKRRQKLQQDEHKAQRVQSLKKLY